MAISMAVMPSDQMSALASYPVCWMTSGAIQNGVPTNVWRCDWYADSCAATPKSAAVSDTVAGGHTELNVAGRREEDVGGLNVAVDLALRVEVVEPE